MKSVLLCPILKSCSSSFSIGVTDEYDTIAVHHKAFKVR